jgi:hypothetical protein
LDTKPEQEHVAAPHNAVAAFDTPVARLVPMADGAFLEDVITIHGRLLDETPLEVYVACAGKHAFSRGPASNRAALADCTQLNDRSAPE